MPQVTFTANLKQHIEIPSASVDAKTVREALDQIFQKIPEARGYILDDQGGVRKHVLIFVNDTQLQDRIHLSDPINKNSQIYVMQALSGG